MDLHHISEAEEEKYLKKKIHVREKKKEMMSVLCQM